MSIIWSTSAATNADSGRYTCLHTGYPDPVFVSVNITVIQPGKIFKEFYDNKEQQQTDLKKTTTTKIINDKLGFTVLRTIAYNLL